MTRIAALIILDRTPIRFAGLDLAERAIRVARRAGIDEIHVVDDDYPFANPPLADLLVVLPERAVVAPAALVDAIDRHSREQHPATLVLDGVGKSTNVMLLTLEAVSRIRGVPRARSAAHRLDILGVMSPIMVAPRYVGRVRDGGDVARAEAEFLRETSGGSGEGFFTRNIRRFSIPLSRRLLRWPITANQVTLAGFGFAIAAGFLFGVGTYGCGLLGALFYWMSMMLDCSDGEVARATLGDSKYGAWLETITDYLSYFVVLGGIVWGDSKVEGFCKHAIAATIAAVASFAIVSIVGYLRARVAGDNPGEFDDALAADLARGTGTQRFAKWGRQLIKRAFVAHLILLQALIGQLPALTEIWACGSVVALFTVVLVHAHIVRTVRVAPLRPAVTL